MHLFEANALVNASINNPAFLRADDHDKSLYHCVICTSKYRFEFEEYSTNFHLLRLVSENNKAVKKGADVTLPMPLFMGVYLSNGLLAKEQLEIARRIYEDSR